MNDRPREVPGLDEESALPLIQGLANVHDSVLLLDPQGRIFWLSDRLASRFGGSEKLRGEDWLKLFADAERGRELDEKLALCGRLEQEGFRLAGATGECGAAMLTAARLGPDPATCPTLAIVRVGDDSSRREFVATIATLRPVLDSCPDAVVIVDRSRFLAYANPAIEQVTGYRPDELVDRPLALFTRSADEVERVALELGPGQPVRGRDLHLRRRDGASQYVSISASLLPGSDGRAAGAVAYLRDVTAERRQEERLARKNEELEHYVHAVSHDLRSPLVSLLGFSRLLRDDYGAKLDDKGRHFLDRVEQAGRTMETLIHDLLELSRIGRSGEYPALVDPVSVLRPLRDELRPRLDSRGVELVLPDDAPSLEFDQTRLYQLFSNLIGNALDHMGPGEHPRIEVQLRAAPDHYLIVVRDNGRGIAPEHHDRIFEIFQSLAAPGEGHRGTGIGLAVVRKIAETRGGCVWVESDPGRGATFKVRLPL